AGEVEDVDRPGEGGRGLGGNSPDDAGAQELAKAAVDGVLGEEGESVGDLADAGFDNEAVAAALGVGKEVVHDGDGVGAVLLHERQGGGIAVLDARLSRHRLRLGWDRVRRGGGVPLWGSAGSG